MTNTSADEAAASPQALVQGLADLLTLAPDGEDAFTGQPQPGGVGRVFGGQVIAQALQAACATVSPERVAHSLHAYFLRGGEEGRPIRYRVERQFDGRSFASRRVVAEQEGTAILTMSAGFQRPEDGLHHQQAELPNVPGPESLEPDSVRMRRVAERLGDAITPAQRAWMLRPRPIEFRSVEPRDGRSRDPRPPLAHAWFRAVASPGDDPALHRAIIAYASDFMLLGTSALPHGLSWTRGELVSASLDHALWFHHPARVDEWLLYVCDSPWSGGGRGFNRGQIFNAAGRLIASVAQEGVIRRQRGTPPATRTG
ncbi:acyl-CoA thioesterase II [Erythrobacteraceae bacterium CFH 75059]|uniref:acyl-CoA thioesterase n=1 Tax=Qipengyuania thermophila TaxID=2509361 RepID=UPI001020556B|nr:acyl-CoA thioesterase II [Qipengyuania thermophila]TCD04923.1 acyl-CoA thioesterase II [Erythrobacteraceae bacterium CFH 75059]